MAGGSLSYVSDEKYSLASDAATKLSHLDQDEVVLTDSEIIKNLEDRIQNMKDLLRHPVADIFGIHFSDLE